MDEHKTQQATLGCGTLILIGLVVLFFTRPGFREVENDVRALRNEVKAVQKEVTAQTEQLRAIRERLEKLAPADGAEKDEK